MSTINASGILLFSQIDSSNWSAEYNSTTILINGGNFPITFNNTDTLNTTLEVTFTTALSFNSATQYFIMGSNNITIDGSNNVVNVNVASYPGLVKNGTSGVNGFSDITIQNVGVESTYGVATNGGWIGQRYFGNGGTNNNAINCYSIGDINIAAGGIFGRESSGSATNCYSTGDIGTVAGGIFGRGSQGSATNCYSTGPIGDGAGGIFGYGSQASASNCYSTGDIGGNAGGIFGNSSSGSATNCYCTGGTNIGVADPSYCYAIDGSANWLDSAADASLNMDGSWTDIDLNSETVPYRLTSFYTPLNLYDPDSSNNAVTEYPSIQNPTDYNWSITSVNGSTSGQTGIIIDASNGDISFTSLSDATYAVNVLAVDPFGNFSFETFTNIISNICFPAGTPIVTNQGIIAIHKINPAIHTIRNKKIVAITKTVSPDKYLVRFEKDALGANLPCETTTMTKNHMLFYKGKMLKAKEFLKTHNESVSKVPYNGQVLYNVLMEEHDKMVVNNLICETLHPENYVAKMHHAFKVLTPKQRVELIQQVNKEIIKRDIFSSTSTFKKSGAKINNEVRAKFSISL